MSTAIQMPESLEADHDELDELQTKAHDDTEVADELPGEIVANGLKIADTSVDEPANPTAETIEIKLRKSTKATASLVVCRDEEGWICKFDCRSSIAGASSQLFDRFETRKAAVLAGINAVTAAIATGKDNRISDDLVKFYTAVEAWPDETSPVDETKAEEAPPVVEQVAATPAPDKIDPEAEYAELLEAAEREVLDTTLAEMRAEEEHKLAKAESKTAREKLSKLMARGPERLPLFDNQQTESSERPPIAEAATDAPADDAEATTETTAKADDESWREVTLDNLGIPDGVLNKLYAVELQTMGDLTYYQKTGKELTTIKGIGSAAAGKIADATEKFWAERNKK